MIWSTKISVGLTVTALCCLQQLAHAFEAISTANHNNQQVEKHDPTTTVVPALISDEPTKKFEEYRRSPLYLPPFEEGLISIPDVQREFINNMVERDFDLIRKILREAIDKRNNFAPSVSLMFKYSGKLLGNFITNRRNEQMIAPRKEQKAEFFQMISHLVEHVLDRSSKIKSEKKYSKSTVNTDELYERADNLMQYMLKVIRASPVSGYLRWNELVVFKNETSNPHHDKDIVEEAGDLVALFKAMGYDKCMFVARRIINLLNMFSKGLLPSEKEV